MVLARTFSVALVGVTPHLVEVEAYVGSQLPGFTLTALSDAVLKQAQHRIKPAVANSGETWPGKKVTVAMAPAAVPKVGSAFDLAMAVTVLAASESLPTRPLDALVLLGELALGGAVKPVPGVLPAVIGAYRHGRRRFVVPRANAAEARNVPGAEILPVGSLAEFCAWLRGELDDTDLIGEAEPTPPVADEGPDLRDVVGQERARRALEVAAAGGHHILLTGPPGVGKTMLAERLPGILPPLTADESLEVTGIHSVAGRLMPGRPLITQPPFSAPHHSSTVAAIVGGGAGIARPGAISLAHRGVLFLDEATEFAPPVLDALRQPLESGQVVLARAGGVAEYPARFLLVLAANPCPCSRTDGVCSCPAPVVQRYRTKLSGPLSDRLDVVVELDPVSRRVLTDAAAAEASADVRRRVEAARGRAAQRLSETPWAVWGEVPGPVLRRQWPIDAPLLRPVTAAVDRGALSTRGIDRVLKLTWTLADLAERSRPGSEDVAEALDLRLGARTPRRLAVLA